MKRLCLCIAFIITSLGTNAQSLFFIGNKSYPSTEAISLYSKSYVSKSINVIIARNGMSGIIALSTESMLGTIIRGKAFIYLDDGSVITLVDRGLYDKENNIATTVYYLTPQEIEMIRGSNINTIRFSIKCKSCVSATDEGSYSVINSHNPIYGRADFHMLISELFE